MLKTSQFTVVESLSEHGLPNHVLVFSTKTDQSVMLKRDDWNTLQRAAHSRDDALDSRRRLALTKLANLGLLVDAAVDEREDLLDKFDAARWHPWRIYPIIAVTTGCNIACTYCYEEGVRPRTMTEQVIDATATWLTRRMEFDGIRELYPSLFGGEPLLYPKLLFRLMDKVNEAARQIGALVAYSCSSNGLFLTPQLARDLVRRRLSQIQISLDGIKPIHDQRRVGKRGESTYEGALAGIEVAADVIPHVTLKVNFDRHNLSAIAPLFDILVGRGLASRINVKLEAIAHQFPNSRVTHDPAKVIPPESTEMADAYTRLQLEAESRGLSVSRGTAHTTPCMLTSNHGVIIGPDGVIYKCISLVGRPEAAVGSIFQSEYDARPYEEQMDVRRKTRECFEENCPYVPVCMGGCGYEASVRGGRPNDRYCTYQNLKRYHFQQKLIRHAAALQKLGMKPLTAEMVGGCCGNCKGRSPIAPVSKTSE